MNTTSRVLKQKKKLRPNGSLLRYRVEQIGYGSFQRHRLLKLWWDSHQSHFKNARILRFGPGNDIEKLVRELPNETFDLVICLHVLERINDRGTLRELHRILSKTGILVAMAQTMDRGQMSYEDPTISDPKAGLVHFSQRDPVGIHGADFRKRVLDTNFSVEEFTPTVPDALLPGEKVFVCRK